MKSYIAHESCGYFERTVRVFVDKKLKSMPYAQCGVIIRDDGAVDFYSYSTLVCTIDALGWLTCTGTYSQTTRKQIGRFLREYAPGIYYLDAKYCAENHVKMNIHTRELADLSE